jgi:hypothetical protein
MTMVMRAHRTSAPKMRTNRLSSLRAAPRLQVLKSLETEIGLWRRDSQAFLASNKVLLGSVNFWKVVAMSQYVDFGIRIGPISKLRTLLSPRLDCELSARF